MLKYLCWTTSLKLARFGYLVLAPTSIYLIYNERRSSLVYKFSFEGEPLPQNIWTWPSDLVSIPFQTSNLPLLGTFYFEILLPLVLMMSDISFVIVTFVANLSPRRSSWRPLPRRTRRPAPSPWSAASPSWSCRLHWLSDRRPSTLAASSPCGGSTWCVFTLICVV